MFIHKLRIFTKITEIKVIEHLKSVAYLRDVLQKSKYFINTVATDNGFLQGLGDSYSTYIIVTIKEVSIPQNRYFGFSNELVGANWSGDNGNFNVLFVSLHTPPNVHKLPEDLAVYLYVDQPVFSNTGTFSYDESMERLFFQTEKSQSTVNIVNQTLKEPINSNLTINNSIPYENILTVTGEKYYQDNKLITRFLEIDPVHKIYIRDYTANNDSLIAYYNVHPSIKIKKISNKQILLQTFNSITFSFISNCNIDIIDGIISENKEEITTIQRLKMTGNPIETTITFPETKLKQAMKIVTNNIEENNRSFYANKLESKYENLKFYESAKKLVIERSIPFLLFLILFIPVSELYALSVRRKL